MYKPLSKSPWHTAFHAQDKLKNLGFDYHGKILEKSISKVILSNTKNRAMLNTVDRMLDYLVDAVKQIKLQYLIALNKNDININ
jgi:hypothetical protein